MRVSIVSPIFVAVLLLLAACKPDTLPGGHGGAHGTSQGEGSAPATIGTGGAGGTCPGSVLPACVNAVCDSDAYCAGLHEGFCDDGQPCQDPCGGPVHMGRCWPPRVDLEPCTRGAQCFAGVCSGGLCGAGHEDGGVSLADAGG